MATGASEVIEYIFTGDVASLVSASEKASAQLAGYANSVSGSFSKIDSATKSLQKVVTRALSSISFGKVMADGIKSAIDFTESVNLFNVAMGDTIETSSEFIHQMADIYGMDPKNLMDTSSAFYLLGDAIGFPAEAAQTMALSLTKAGNDIASLYNTDVETAVSNLQSALQGNSRAVRKYGYDVTQATLAQYAMQYGITQSVSSLSEVNKRALRYIALMDQMHKATDQVSSDATHAGERFGDFANTIEQPANQIRIFKEQLAMLGRAIGNFFITPLATAMAYINGFIMALRSVISFIGSLIGILGVFSYSGGKSAAHTAEETSEAIGGIGGSAGNAAKELKKLIAPFDELTTLNEEMNASGGGGGGGGGKIQGLDPALLAAIEEMELKLENIRMKAIEVRDTILEWLGFKISGDSILSWDGKVLVDNLGKATGLVKTFTAIYEHWHDIIQGIKDMWTALGGVVDELKERFKRFVTTVVDPALGDFFSNLGSSLSTFAQWITDHTDDIADFIELLAQLLIAVKAFKIVGTILAPILTLVTSIAVLIATYTLAAASDLAVLTAGVAATVGQALLWAAVIAALVAALVQLWNTDNAFRQEVSEAWQNLVGLLSRLWNEVLKPICDAVWGVLTSLWNDLIKPIVSRIVQLVLSLWNDILAPLIDALITILGPTVVNVITTIGKFVQTLFQDVGAVIDGILQFLQGLIQFIGGIFTGDLNKIFEGWANMCEGLGKAIMGIAKGVLNTVIAIINTGISFIWSAFSDFVNHILALVNSIGGIFGASWDLSISTTPPQIGYIPMATGGYVQNPTTALIGEAGREAVLPLDQNTGWADIVADKITSAMGMTEDQPIVVNVYLDGRKITQEVTKRQKQVAMAKGV